MADQLFDMSKMDYEGIRLRRRKRLLLWSIPIVVIVLAVALWCLSPFLLTSRAISSYNTGNYRGARSVMSPLQLTSPQKFVVYFDIGTIDSKSGNFVKAETELTNALAFTPNNKICMVKQNLEITLERRADGMFQRGKAKDAILYYSKAISTIESASNCFKPQVKKRVEKKKQRAEDYHASKNQNNYKNPQANPNRAPSQSQIEKIHERERKARGQQHDDQFSKKKWKERKNDRLW